MRSQQSEHIGQVFGIDLSSERLSSADTEIGGVRKATSGTGDVNPTTAVSISRAEHEVRDMCGGLDGDGRWASRTQTTLPTCGDNAASRSASDPRVCVSPRPVVPYPGDP